MTTRDLAAACDLQIKVPPYATRIAVTDRPERRERYQAHGRLTLTWAQLVELDADKAAAVRRLLAATDKARAVLCADEEAVARPARPPATRQPVTRAAPAQLLLDRVEVIPGHQSACFAGERQEKRGLK